MQAVILAAGRGTRMGELVEKVPKPMLEVAGKTLLEHKFDALPDDADEIILVVGYLADAVKNRFGGSYNGKKIAYVTQENIYGGTADALWQARDILREKFIVMMGDDIYAREDIEAIRVHDWALLVQRVPDTAVGGKVVTDLDNRIVDIIEGNEGGEGVVSANMFALTSRIFDFPQVPKAAGSSEMGLPQTILAASKESGVPFDVVEATKWIQISNPDDLVRAEVTLGS
ncbi:MAG TPA: sugar phosphate nucleotidyltransferase [Candidatus Paceibacterota bacterium]|nr:sugar phosphate nucleotidyltransferase [Candidatus Paceibacterota bacterium]